MNKLVLHRFLLHAICHRVCVHMYFKIMIAPPVCPMNPGAASVLFSSVPPMTS